MMRRLPLLLSAVVIRALVLAVLVVIIVGMGAVRAQEVVPRNESCAGWLEGGATVNIKDSGSPIVAWRYGYSWGVISAVKVLRPGRTYIKAAPALAAAIDVECADAPQTPMIDAALSVLGLR